MRAMRAGVAVMAGVGGARMDGPRWGVGMAGAGLCREIFFRGVELIFFREGLAESHGLGLCGLTRVGRFWPKIAAGTRVC